MKSLWILPGLVLLGVIAVGASRPDYPKPAFDADNNLERPEGYREWVFVGTPVTPNDLNPPEAAFPEFHNVYIHPADFAHWRRTGTFPDGTVIIKELVSVGSKQAVSGKGYFMGAFVGLEATVKDRKRFPDEPGHWAYFSFGHSLPLADAAAPFPTAACNACHAASAADDFVFTQYYPVLAAAKGARGGRTMGPGDEEFDRISRAMSNALPAAMEPTAPTAPTRGAVPTDAGELFTYLRDGEYKKLAASESGNHPSAGPHAKYGRPVRVFLDATLDRSLREGREQHPVGASAVKEMYTPDGKLHGWAVMVKTENQSAGGQGWFWYEVTSTENGSDPVAAGNGVPLCFGCHAGGDDFVLTSYPLK